MPSGVSWSRYLSALVAASVSMFAGAQCVHMLYRPLEDFESIIEAEKENRKMKRQTNDGHHSQT